MDFSAADLATTADPGDSAATSRRKFIGQAAGVGLAAAALLSPSDSRADAGPDIGQSKPAGRPASSVAPVLAGLDPDTTRTLLDEVGRLRHVVSAETFAAWKRELNKTRLIETVAPRKAALLHILVGEYLLAENGGNEPAKAGWHFRRARQLVGVRDRLHGWAAYNGALGVYYEGGYADSATGFHDLLHHDPPLIGFDRRRAALWLRHAGACEAEHAKLDDLGIRRPLRLDPLCGVAGLCVSLKALRLPGSDKKTVMANTRITGRGTSAQDLLDACATGKIGGGMASGRALTCDEEGLKHLPMPVIASVMRDHFVTLVEADKDGVTYLCTDCGAWPGGKNKLTWEQWRAMKPGVYVSVTKRGSLSDRVLAALVDHPTETKREASLTTSGIPGIQVAMNPLRDGQTLGSSLVPLSSMFRQLENHVKALLALPLDVTCGYSPDSTDCPEWLRCCNKHNGGPGGGGSGGPGGGGGGSTAQSATASGPSAGDPVNLATLQEEYTPAADITIYNPNGPAITWSRLYNSLRGDDEMYEYDDFGYGWSHSYNYAIHSTVYAGPVTIGPHPNAHGGGGGGAAPAPPTAPQYIVFPNGARVGFTIPSMPTHRRPASSARRKPVRRFLSRSFMTQAPAATTPFTTSSSHSPTSGSFDSTSAVSSQTTIRSRRCSIAWAMRSTSSTPLPPARTAICLS